MVFKKRATRRRPRFRFRGRKRHKDRRISIIGTTGAIGSLFVPQGGTPQRMSMGQWFTEWTQGRRRFRTEDVQKMLYDGMGQYVGYHPTYGWGIPWGTVTIVGAGIAASIANRFGGKYIRNLPFIGKYVKF